VTLKTALEQGAAILEKAKIGVPRLTAEVLLGHAMRCDRAYLFAHATDELTELAWIHYGRYLNERVMGKPTQYITGKQEFYGREFYVNSDVLIPRPETEHLAEAGIAWLRQRSDARALDVGTGHLCLLQACGRLLNPIQPQPKGALADDEVAALVRPEE